MENIIQQIWNNQSTTEHIVYITLIVLFIVGLIIITACGGLGKFIWHQTKVHTKDENLRQTMIEIERDKDE